MATDPLLQPFQLKRLTLRNRIMITSHEPAYTEDGLPKDRYRAYHAERAKAGIALTMTAGSAIVSRDSAPAFGNILLWKDECVPWMKNLADECRDHGAAVMIQLTHMGRRTRWDRGDWLPVISPSAEREPAHRAVPKIIEDWDIKRLIRDYADAAERMQAAGLDGIEVESYGHLMDAFWSPRLNALDGIYDASSIENRMRFTFDVLGAIRERVGPEFIVGMRYVADEDIAGGISKEDGLAISQRLKDSGMIDFINIIRGHIDTDAALTDVIPVQGMRNAPHLDFAGELRAATQLPTFHAAKIPDVATARHAIASGKLDMVGMTRAHIADPHIVRKIVEGREDAIRPCVGANYCLDRIYQGGMALCLHNPSTGRELEQPHEIEKAPAPKRVTIVGAGPGGLEAARVAAERGHHVTVLEAADQPGGQIRLTALQERRREMLSVTEWRYEQCQELGVQFQFNMFAEADDVLATKPDEVIIATGGLPNEDVLSAGNNLTVSAWDILSGDVKPGQNVLVFDEAGDHAGLMAADLLSEAGANVEIVTWDRSLAPEIMAMSFVPYMRNMQKRGVRFTVTWRLDSVAREGNVLKATLGTDYGGASGTRLVDQIVVNGGTVPLDDLYFNLKPMSRNLGEIDYEALIAREPIPMHANPEGTFGLYRIGDAIASRNTHAAIYDGLRVGRVL